MGYLAFRADRPGYPITFLAAHTGRTSTTTADRFGQLRAPAGKHFAAQLLAIDPHRMHSYSQRQMRRHPLQHPTPNPAKWPRLFSSLGL